MKGIAKTLLWSEMELAYQEKMAHSFDTVSDHLIEQTRAETLMSKTGGTTP